MFIRRRVGPEIFLASDQDADSKRSARDAKDAQHRMIEATKNNSGLSDHNL